MECSEEDGGIELTSLAERDVLCGEPLGVVDGDADDAEVLVPELLETVGDGICLCRVPERDDR